MEWKHKSKISEITETNEVNPKIALVFVFWGNFWQQQKNGALKHIIMVLLNWDHRNQVRKAKGASIYGAEEWRRGSYTEKELQKSS